MELINPQTIIHKIAEYCILKPPALYDLLLHCLVWEINKAIGVWQFNAKI